MTIVLRLSLTEPERELIELALARMRWELVPEERRLLNGGQVQACRYTISRIDELQERLQLPAPEGQG
ncbi:MAG: hypothetical protein KF822_09555 [Steroidobacteraceae bacterium]|nr:hypothetical protein [Steroidobacteraceae bacterium]